MPSVAVRRRAVGGRQPFSRHDLPAHRDLRRRRGQRAQPGADGARRREGARARRVRRRARVRRAGVSRTSARFVAARPELRRPFHPVPRRPGIAGVAANFVLHVSDLMDGPESARRMSVLVGLDVGSTTVKAVAWDVDAGRIVWQDYQRHEARQPEKVLAFLRRMEAEVGLAEGRDRVFLTGSGGSSLAPLVGAKFVQEVTAVCLAVETLHPDVNAVIELGGQDAKIIVFRSDGSGDRRRKLPSMNDKCAGGTGAIIDKIAAKLSIAPDALCDYGYDGVSLHPVAGKCGVFAETDINGLQKRGVPPDELMASLFDAIVQQNLTVLARGQTLRPVVLLLGGPNTFIRGMREAWQPQHPADLARARRRGARRRAGRGPDPRSSQRAVLRRPWRGRVRTPRGRLGRRLCRHARRSSATSTRAGWSSERERAGAVCAPPTPSWPSSDESVARPPFVQSALPAGPARRGLPRASTAARRRPRPCCCRPTGACSARPTSSRAAIRSRTPSRSPAACDPRWNRTARRLTMLGVGTTGYAKDILRDVLQADTALVETVAHTEAALALLRRPARHRRRRRPGHQADPAARGPHRRLQAEHAVLGGQRLLPPGHGRAVRHSRRARTPTWRSRRRPMPTFGYGCAVFLQSTSSAFSGRAGRPARFSPGWPPCCRRTSSCTSRRSRTWRSSARDSSFRAGRRTTWRS